MCVHQGLGNFLLKIVVVGCRDSVFRLFVYVDILRVELSKSFVVLEYCSFVTVASEYNFRNANVFRPLSKS